MAAVLDYFFKKSQDRSTSVIKTQQLPESLIGKRDNSVPPKNNRFVQNKVNESNPDSTNSKNQSIFDETKKSETHHTKIFDLSNKQISSEKPTINIPLYQGSSEEKTPNSIIKESKISIEEQTNPKNTTSRFKLDFNMQDIRKKLSELGTPSFPKPFPQHSIDIEDFDKSLTSKPITKEELQNFLQGSTGFSGSKEEKLRKFINVKKELDFCKKYIKINEIKKGKIIQEIEGIKAINSSYSNNQSGMGGVLDETMIHDRELEEAIQKEKQELDWIKSQLHQNKNESEQSFTQQPVSFIVNTKPEKVSVNSMNRSVTPNFNNQSPVFHQVNQMQNSNNFSKPRLDGSVPRGLLQQGINPLSGNPIKTKIR